MNCFHTDLEWSLDERDNDMFDSLYRKVFPRVKDIHFADDIKTQKKGIDKIITFENGNFVTIDEKKRRKDYGDILLEIWSVDYDVPGWLYTSHCDYIAYAIMPTLKVYLLPTLLLQAAWKTNCKQWLSEHGTIKAKNKDYITTSIGIPVQVLLKAIHNETQQHFQEEV